MGQENIKLNFINRSNDVNNSSVVLFQKNVASASNTNGSAIAWRVFKNSTQNECLPFSYPLQLQVCSSNANKNIIPCFNAYDGESFEMVKDTSGDVLALTEIPATSPHEVEIKNNLAFGSIDANIYRDGKLLAVKHDVIPGEKAAFKFHPHLSIAVIPDVEEGKMINSSISQQTKTELNLSGIQSADIVMSGGGSGANASAYKFTLEKINR